MQPATKQIRAVSSNGDASASKPLQESALSRLKRILPHREDVVVAGREVKGGIVIHPIIATAILGAIVTVGLSIRSEMNWQHDQLVILSTQKLDADKRADERAEELAKRLQNMDAVQIVLGRDIVKLQEAQKGRN